MKLNLVVVVVLIHSNRMRIDDSKSNGNSSGTTATKTKKEDTNTSASFGRVLQDDEAGLELTVSVGPNPIEIGKSATQEFTSGVGPAVFLTGQTAKFNVTWFECSAFTIVRETELFPNQWELPDSIDTVME